MNALECITTIAQTAGGPVSVVPTTTQVLGFAALGSVLPPLLKVLAWVRLGKEGRSTSDLDAIDLSLGTLIHLTLAIVACLVLPVADRLAAIAIGYAAPELLVKAVGAAYPVPKPSNDDTPSPKVPANADPDEIKATASAADHRGSRIERVWAFLQI